jgi:hypothetical protein
LFATVSVFAEEKHDLELTLDAAAKTIPLPKIFKPSIDLSGRGFHNEPTWPQTVAAKVALDKWKDEVGFSGLYRLQYNLWEINQLSKDKDLQAGLLSNYDLIIKTISDAGGVVMLDIFGTPAGLGQVLDKKSPPWDLKAFKEIVKGTIRDLSCNKKYNIWYEAWTAPDLDDFFLGRRQEYLNLYRATAEAVKELEAETKTQIPLGGPSVSWWFQDLDGNTILTPEKSLIYELIRFCAHHKLPLDFISWHAYSSDPAAEKENTTYNKSPVELIRAWLSYFKFDRNTPLIVDEWNYDRSANDLPERKNFSAICASYIPGRIKGMYEAGIDYQTFFCLEDFQGNKEGVVRNVGIFSFDPRNPEHTGFSKSVYNVFRMLANLGKEMIPLKINDEFIKVIATRSPDQISLIICNYIDPEIIINYLSRDISNLNGAGRRALLNIVKSDKLEKVVLKQLDISGLRTTARVGALLKKASELKGKAKAFERGARNIKIGIKNLKENFIYQRYKIDSSCSANCEFVPTEEKEVNASDLYQEVLSIDPYSVQMIILKRKPKEEAAVNTDTTATTQETVVPSAAAAKNTDGNAEKKE